MLVFTRLHGLGGPLEILQLGSAGPGGGGVLPYITYTGMCRPKGRDFEAPDLERGIHFRGVF